jgi:hypothetical protein
MGRNWLGAAAAAAALAAVSAAAPAGAQLFNGWQYAIDSLNDGSGGSSYEIKGVAYQLVGNTARFAFSSNMQPGGNIVSGARNGNIALGDLFLNFSGGNLNTAGAFSNPKVLAIRFDGTNDSLGNISGSNTSTGVYKNVTAASFTAANSGYASLQAYINAGFGRNPDAMGDLESSTGDVTTYFSNGTMYPNIGSGTYAGGITLLDRTAVVNTYGLNFAHFGADTAGPGVYGFAFDRSLLPSGSFTASLFEECINDGVAIKGSNVPEPSTLAVMGVGATGFSALLWWRRRAK